METKFTKGEWECVIRKVDGELFDSLVYVPGGGLCTTNMPDAEANAHLIASAPEMYEMLDDISKSIAEFDLRNEIEQLLAKARGEQ